MEPATSQFFGPLVETCRAHGIGKTVAFDLAARGLIDTFKIGSRRFVKLASLASLPDRLAAIDDAKPARDTTAATTARSRRRTEVRHAHAG